MAPNPMDSDARVFQMPGSWILVVFLLGGIPFLLLTLIVAIIQGIPESMKLPYIIVHLIMIFGTVLSLKFVIDANNKTYVAISPNGIEYSTLHMKIYAPWRAALSIGDTDNVRSRYKSEHNEVLFVDPKQIEHDLPRSMLVKVLTPEDVFIPLDKFASNSWREHEIGKLIQQYAPHLYETSS